MEEVLEESAEELLADVVEMGSDDEVSSAWKSQNKESGLPSCREVCRAGEWRF